MDYFSHFPTITYRQTEAGVSLDRNVPNMTTLLRMDLDNIKGVSYTTMRLVDGERPDTVAAKTYGSSRYAWIVLLANGMRDEFAWPMSEQEWSTFIDQKYETTPGAKDGMAAAHDLVYARWWTNPVTGSKVKVDATFAATRNTSEIEIETTLEWERTLNDAKRTIRVPTLQTLPTILKQREAAVVT